MHSLVAESLAKSYPTSADQSLQVLVEASLRLSPGENVAILGPSGSGKSTLLAILGTLDRPTSGTMHIGDVDPFQLPEPELAKFRSRQIGFVFQDHHLLPQCTVLENVLVPFLADGSAGREEIAQGTTLIGRVGLAERLLHRPAQLSGGERQRVALARALVRRPALVLADEPTGNLDGSTAEEIARLLLELQAEQNSMLVIVTHSEHLAAQMQRRLKIADGVLMNAAK
ncbi:MAG: ABC transporter ATP-binding protein [Bythopirellula sp.]|nr:ABC transporter ATP-binding protein [Bythopirellula sp.]